MPDRILADLHHHVVTGLEGLLDLAGGATQTGGLPVHLAGVEHAVAAAADVDERRLHRRQHILHNAQVDVADQGGRGHRGHEMLDHHAVFEHRDLGVAGALVGRFGADLVPHHHHTFDGLAAGQELGLAEDGRPTPSGVAPVPATLPFRFQPGRAADSLNLAGIVVGAGRALVHHGVRRVIRRAGGAVPAVARTGLAATTPAPPTGRALSGHRVVIAVVLIGLVGGIRLVIAGRGVTRVGVVIVWPGVRLFAATTTAPPAPATSSPVSRPLGLVVVNVIRAGLVVVEVVLVIFGGHIHCGLDRLGRDEKRHVLGMLDRGLQHQPGFGLAGLRGQVSVRRDGLRPGFGGRLVVRSDVGGVGGQHVAHPDGVGAVHAGLHAAGSPVELAERVQHPSAGGPQRTRQGVDPQPVRQILLVLCRGFR